MYPGLVSCPFYAIPIYPFKFMKFFIYLYIIRLVLLYIFTTLQKDVSNLKFGGICIYACTVSEAHKEGLKQCPAAVQETYGTLVRNFQIIIITLQKLYMPTQRYYSRNNNARQMHTPKTASNFQRKN